jgi:hypothetical protein
MLTLTSRLPVLGKAISTHGPFRPSTFSRSFANLRATLAVVNSSCHIALFALSGIENSQMAVNARNSIDTPNHSRVLFCHSLWGF